MSLDLNFDYPVIDAEQSNEFGWHLKHVESLGYVEKSGVHYYLTAKGWDYLMGPSGGGAIPGRCFVAMSFSEEHESIYSDGIHLAVKDAGYDPVWMKDVLTNEDICHRMIVEIRKSQFLIADFTGLKAGVYFEAGFAMGLGRQVFWTTHAADMGKVHFDTNHYQHILWKTPEMCSALIRTIAPGSLSAAILGGTTRLQPFKNDRYGLIGTGDWSMFPVIPPGSLVVIDGTKRRIATSGWTTEFERPIYFLEHRDGYACGWCTLRDRCLVVQPHPAPHCRDGTILGSSPQPTNSALRFSIAPDPVSVGPSLRGLLDFGCSGEVALCKSQSAH